ncbi:MAG: EAL domain-containing protein, partial [Oscillospiraceae bacterium]
MSIIDTLTKASGMDVFLREISDTNTYKPVAFSVQVRITDSKMGILLPEVFMPVAEKTAKAKQILLWSVKKCMTMMQNLTKRDIPFDFFALYCPETFICDVVAVEEFLSLVSDKNMLNLFAFYISPSLLISQNSTVNDNIVLLRSLGVRFIVLNFGCEGFPLSKVLKATFDMVVLDDFMVECLCGEEQEKNYAT